MGPDQKNKKTAKPLWIGFSGTIVAFVIFCFSAPVINKLFPASSSGLDMSKIIATMIMLSVSALALAYCISLTITGAYYWYRNRYSKTYINTHPYLWAIPLAVLVGLIIKIIMEAGAWRLMTWSL